MLQFVTDEWLKKAQAKGLDGQTMLDDLKAMPATFDQLQAKGFKFVTVSELIAMGKPMAPKQTGEYGVPPSPSPSHGPTATPVPAASPAPSLTNS